MNMHVNATRTKNAAEVRAASPRRKPRLLLIGHMEHGKDTAGELIRALMGLKFASSSAFVGERHIWPLWGKTRYTDFESMFKDRVHNRKAWADMITEYNTPNRARTATEIFESGCDVYVGMRRRAEFEACMALELFDHVIWVDASSRLPNEPRSSMELTRDDADIVIHNSGPIENMRSALIGLQVQLDDAGFNVNMPVPEEKAEPASHDRAARERDALAEAEAGEPEPSYQMHSADAACPGYSVVGENGNLVINGCLSDFFHDVKRHPLWDFIMEAGSRPENVAPWECSDQEEEIIVENMSTVINVGGDLIVSGDFVIEQPKED